MKMTEFKKGELIEVDVYWYVGLKGQQPLESLVISADGTVCNENWVIGVYLGRSEHHDYELIQRAQSFHSVYTQGHGKLKIFYDNLLRKIND
ncbi:MAG TPA: hypothetical protein VMW36_05415 [Patescibacteria group bacterium]|nr:hypothetical protein [Patescibacteria group bacterium]